MGGPIQIQLDKRLAGLTGTLLTLQRLTIQRDPGVIHALEEDHVRTTLILLDARDLATILLRE